MQDYYWQTGIPELDRLLFDGRGFKSGRAYFITGEHQSGKTIIAMCFVKNMINQGGAFTYISIGRSARYIIELYKQFNIDINKYLEDKDLVILDWASLNSGGNIDRIKNNLKTLISEKAISNIRFGKNPCDKNEFLDKITNIHEEKAKTHNKPGLAVIDAISDQILMVDRKNLPENIVSEIYFEARQRFSNEEPGTAFHLADHLENRVKDKHVKLLEDLHLNEDGTINLSLVKDENDIIQERILTVKSLFGGKTPTQRLKYEITNNIPIKVLGRIIASTIYEKNEQTDNNTTIYKQEVIVMPGGFNFFGNVTVNGDMVNIEGNQYNIGTDSKNQLLNMINDIITKGVESGGDVIPTIDSISNTFNQRRDITSKEIATSIHNGLQEVDINQNTKEHLESIYNKLAIGASGSLLATGIVEGIRLLLGF